MPPMDADQLRQYLEFYQDLGIKSVYKRPGPGGEPAPVSAPPPAPSATAAPALVTPGEAPKAESMLQIMQDIGDCTPLPPARGPAQDCLRRG